MRVLCVYATRQVDSNLMMSSMVFDGLRQNGYHVDMIFLGYQKVLDVVEERYSKYFDNIEYLTIKESALKRTCDKWSKTRLLYSFYRHFVMDTLWRPYSRGDVARAVKGSYDVVLSFIPSVLCGFLARDVKAVVERTAPTRLVQFWTDPLSLGRCNDVNEIPRTRFMHVRDEHRLLGFADKAVFCYPMLCEMEQKLHPQFANKMTWSDVGYINHSEQSVGVARNALCDSRIGGGTTVGLFGSYQKNVRNISPLLEAMGYFPKVDFILRGDSDIKIDPDIYPNLDVVEGRRPMHEVEALEARCDILLCLGASSGITQPAGKAFYYANYAKPILYIVDGPNSEQHKQYLRGFGRFEVCDNQVQSIREGLERVISQLKDFKLVIPERLEPKNVAARLIE